MEEASSHFWWCIVIEALEPLVRPKGLVTKTPGGFSNQESTWQPLKVTKLSFLSWRSFYNAAVSATPQAESELQRATMDATRTTRQLEETIDEFEKQKIRDIKVRRGLLFLLSPPPSASSPSLVSSSMSRLLIKRVQSPLVEHNGLFKPSTESSLTRRWRFWCLLVEPIDNETFLFRPAVSNYNSFFHEWVSRYSNTGHSWASCLTLH